MLNFIIIKLHLLFGLKALFQNEKALIIVPISIQLIILFFVDFQYQFEYLKFLGLPKLYSDEIFPFLDLRTRGLYLLQINLKVFFKLYFVVNYPFLTKEEIIIV